MTEFILPDIGEGIVECELLEWLVEEGDEIIEDQAVAEVMTDKATVQIPAMHNGVVEKLHYKAGDIAKVHSPLFAMRILVDNKVAKPAEPLENNAVKSESSEHASKAEVNIQTKNNVQTENFILPDIGEGIVECEIVKWCIDEGSVLEEDQVVVEVMTDKAVVEIPAKYAGKVTRLYYQEGEIAKVHSALFEQSINVNDTEKPTLSDDVKDEHETANSSNAKTQNQTQNHSKNKNNKIDKQGGQFEAPIKINGKVLTSPAIRRIARENDIDLSSIAGSGKKGRILKQDLNDALKVKLDSTNNLASKPVEANSNQSSRNQYNTKQYNTDTESQKASQKFESQGYRTIKIKGMRAAMAKQMTASVSTIPHFSVSDELCMDQLIKLKSQLKPMFKEKGLSLSFMPFFIKAMSLALLEFEEINAHMDDEANELRVIQSHNIGLAVDSKLGLLVPNIKNVQDLSLLEVTQELNRIVDAAREGKLSSTDLSGGSISISNIGVLGGTSASPVINKPEVAIVALGKTQTLPRFDEDGKVIASNIMNVSWSGDHRVIDGATMVRFNNLWMSYLTTPEKMLVHLR